MITNSIHADGIYATAMLRSIAATWQFAVTIFLNISGTILVRTDTGISSLNNIGMTS